jgi:hypothetical protein
VVSGTNPGGIVNVVEEWRGPVDIEHRLADCEGFVVEGTAGRLGIVGATQCERSGAVKALIVFGGLLGNRVWIVPAEDVAVVQPRRQRVGLIDKPVGVRLVGHDAESRAEMAGLARSGGRRAAS